MFERSKLVGAEYFKSIGVSEQPTCDEIQAKLQAQSAYSVFGLTANAAFTEVKAAYRKLIRQFHPDRYRLAQAALGHDYDDSAITAVANSVTYALTTAYTRLSAAAQAATASDAPIDSTVRGGPIDLSRMFFPVRPPLVDKTSAREFIARMETEISSVIQQCPDEETYRAIKEVMQALQRRVKANEDLLLPDLAPVRPNGSAQSQALSRTLYRHGVHHTQFHVFLLECLDDVESAKQALSASMPNEPAQSPRSKCQVMMDVLTFLIKKMCRVLSCNGEPIYQEGLYNGLFPAPKPSASALLANANTTLGDIECKLKWNAKQAEDVERTMTPEHSCTSNAL
jgi:hypothetical protein